MEHRAPVASGYAIVVGVHVVLAHRAPWAGNDASPTVPADRVAADYSTLADGYSVACVAKGRAADDPTELVFLEYSSAAVSPCEHVLDPPADADPDSFGAESLDRAVPHVDVLYAARVDPGGTDSGSRRGDDEAIEIERHPVRSDQHRGRPARGSECSRQPVAAALGNPDRKASGVPREAARSSTCLVDFENSVRAESNVCKQCERDGR